MSELSHLELLAEVDALVAELRLWAEHAPDWPPARACQALVRRLAERADTLRVRLEAPLIVATLGGTGTGKSTLVNALVGAEVTSAGHLRPTTRQPVLICSPRITPQALGIDPDSVQLVQRDLPALRDIVLLDCPDPDTTESIDGDGTNLARLRALLPHCDVLLVTSTQQKYRSARVASELAAAAHGARLVFVQTHADRDDDVREDWRRALAEEYAVGEVFLVDSLAALADAQTGQPPRGDFARLVDLLTRQLAGTAGRRIRRANFLDLADEAPAGRGLTPACRPCRHSKQASPISGRGCRSDWPARCARSCCPAAARGRGGCWARSRRGGVSVPSR
jgi:energy-coupling factor transporter ATP-binding protein EcfA2